MSAAARTGAVLVMMDNLYVFGRGADADARGRPDACRGHEGLDVCAMATDLLTGHAEGRFRATLARASDSGRRCSARCSASG